MTDPSQSADALTSLLALTEQIRKTRQELAALRARGIRIQDLPAATDELDAVVEATAEATGTILDAAETLERVAASLAPASGEQVIEQVTRIYEACSFQDITGQRISKVVKLLHVIESRLDSITLALQGDVSRQGKGGKGGRSEDTTGRSATHRKEAEAALLNGPAMPGQANTQDDVDRIFSTAHRTE